MISELFMTVLQTVFNPEMINKPLFIEDFVSDSLKYDSVKTLLSRYVKSGDLKRYSQGIYYVPRKTVLGESILSFESIIERKYINDNGRQFGYYSGNTLLNLTGLSTQVPNTPEITTNKESNRNRKVKIGNRYVVLRCSETEINNDNAPYLQYLDIFRYSDLQTLKESKDKVIAFFDKQNLSFEKLSSIEQSMPMKIRKALRRSGVYDELAYR